MRWLRPLGQLRDPFILVGNCFLMPRLSNVRRAMNKSLTTGTLFEMATQHHLRCIRIHKFPGHLLSRCLKPSLWRLSHVQKQRARCGKMFGNHIWIPKRRPVLGWKHFVFWGDLFVWIVYKSCRCCPEKVPSMPVSLLDDVDARPIPLSICDISPNLYIMLSYLPNNQGSSHQKPIEQAQFFTWPWSCSSLCTTTPGSWWWSWGWWPSWRCSATIGSRQCCKARYDTRPANSWRWSATIGSWQCCRATYVTGRAKWWWYYAGVTQWTWNVYNVYIWNLVTLVWPSMAMTPWQDDEQEPRKRRRINKGMSPNTKEKILEQQLTQKRENSRKWHQQYVSKGVICPIWQPLVFLFFAFWGGCLWSHLHLRFHEGARSLTRRRRRRRSNPKRRCQLRTMLDGTLHLEVVWLFGQSFEYRTVLSFFYAQQQQHAKVRKLTQEGKSMKEANMAWMASAERAALMAGSKGVQLWDHKH